MKLTRKNLIELIKLKNEGWTSYQIKKKIGITVRRIDQIYKEYQTTEKIPEIGKRIGRPKRQVTKKEIQIIRRAYSKYRICASRLTNFIQRDYNVALPHYHIHKVLLGLDYADSHGEERCEKEKLD